ncbi:MAG: hypothetical protein J3Q66DRAFT_335221, partial [Benniella sp.]
MVMMIGWRLEAVLLLPNRDLRLLCGIGSNSLLSTGLLAIVIGLGWKDVRLLLMDVRDMRKMLLLLGVVALLLKVLLLQQIVNLLLLLLRGKS